MVYVTADKLYAIDMYNGTLAWKWETPSFWEFSSPTMEGDVIYIGGAGGYLHAIDADSGSEIWTFETGEREYLGGSEVNKEAGGGVTATPAVGPDYIYIVDWDENLYAVDKNNGEPVFTQGFEDTIPGTNTPIEWGPIDMGAGDGFASVALDMDSNMLFIGDTAGNMWGLSMDPDDNGFDDDGNGRIDDEGDVIWDYATGDAISASASVYDGTVYVSSWDQTIYAFDAQSGNVEWSETFDGYPWGSVSVADGMVFQNTLGYDPDIGRMGWTFAFDAESGNVVWSFEQNEFMVSTPTPYNGKLLVGDCGYRLIAFGPDGPKPDLYIEDVTVSEKDDDDECVIYVTFGNKGGVRGPPAELNISVEGKTKFSRLYGPLDAGELEAGNVKVKMESGSNEIKVKVTQRPSAWYHIHETNTGNNDKTVKVGGVVQMVTSPPGTFILGIVIGGIAAWFIAGWLATRKEDEWDEDPES